jgi:hypothetical protein
MGRRRYWVAPGPFTHACRKDTVFWRDHFPTIFVLSPEGIIQHAIVGYTTLLGLRWQLWRDS